MAFTYEVVIKKTRITDTGELEYSAVIYVKDDTKNNEREAYGSIRSLREEAIEDFVEDAEKNYPGIVVIDDNEIEP